MKIELKRYKDTLETGKVNSKRLCHTWDSTTGAEVVLGFVQTSSLWSNITDFMTVMMRMNEV